MKNLQNQNQSSNGQDRQVNRQARVVMQTQHCADENARHQSRIKFHAPHPLKPARWFDRAQGPKNRKSAKRLRSDAVQNRSHNYLKIRIYGVASASVCRCCL